MSQVVLIQNNEVVYVHEITDIRSYSTGSQPFARERDSEWAVSVATRLREAGVTTARALTSKGQRIESEEIIRAELAKSTPAAVADTRPSSYRGVKPEFSKGMWFIKWTDPATNQGLCVSGSTPQEALERLFNSEHPNALRYVATLPPEDGEPPAAPNTSETPAAAPVKALRPGDARSEPQEPPQRRAPVQDSEFANARIREYVEWEAAHSVPDLKQRLKTDLDFSRWYLNQNAAGVQRDTKQFFERRGQ